MPASSYLRKNSPANGPAVASLFIGLMGPMPMDAWDDGPKYRGTNTTQSSRRTCFNLSTDEGEGPFSADMIPSPLGRGLPSRHGFGKSF